MVTDLGEPRLWLRPRGGHDLDLRDPVGLRRRTAQHLHHRGWCDTHVRPRPDRDTARNALQVPEHTRDRLFGILSRWPLVYPELNAPQSICREQKRDVNLLTLEHVGCTFEPTGDGHIAVSRAVGDLA